MVSITFAILTHVRQIAGINTGRISFLLPFVGYFGCLLMTLGQMLRIVAIFTLRRQFTVRVSIIKDHKIIDTGIYRIVRHPAYLGSLLTFLGAGLALENWITLIVLFFLPLAATVYRIGVEERALLDHFGAAYQAYARRTRRLIPGIY